MKKVLLLSLLAFMAISLYSQETAKTVITKPGINSKVPVTATSEKINLIKNLTSDAQAQLNLKANKADSISPWTYVYSKQEVADLIPFTTPVQSNTEILHNGTGSLTTIFTGSIPAGSITTTGQFDVLAIFGYSGTASKVIQVKFGSNAVIQTSPTTQLSGVYPQTIANQNSLTNQIAGNLGAGLGSSSSGFQRFTFNTAAEIPVTVAVNVPVGESATLLFLRVRAIKR